MTRVFDAPRRLVFDAFTKPEHLVHWWGPCVFKLVVCDVDLRVGGAYRFVLRAPDGSEIAFNGIYREISSPSRLVCTQVFEAMPDHPALVTLMLEELASGTTKMTETILHETAGARDAHVASGMEGGASESMDRLDELLRAIR